MTLLVTKPAGVCDNCGHLLAGTIAVGPFEDPETVCEPCADAMDARGTVGIYVKPRFDPRERRWHPVDGEQRRMYP